MTVANTCIAGNGPITSVVNASGPTIDARGNWWGAADGPSGVGPGSGDSVSSGVDYGGFLTTPPVDGCPAPTVDLTVSRSGTGAGTVTSSPAGIDCGVDCLAAFDVGRVVTLTATPAISSTFAGWSGACNGTGTCALTLSQSTWVTATFTIKAHSLTVSAAGNGNGNVSSVPAGIDCGSACNQVFDYGTIVTLTATPAVSSTFGGWSGACGGAVSCVVTLTQSAQITATFTLKAISLTASLAGNGSGQVSSAPSGINCGSTCSAAFDYGTMVTLTATPAVSSTFLGWTGACGGVGACVVTMTQTTEVSATFSLKSYSLMLGRAGNGSGSVSSFPVGIDCGLTCAANFHYGTVVSLTAQPTASSTFAGWQGGCAGLATCVVTLAQPTLVTATFSLNSYTVVVVLSGTGGGMVTSLPAGINCGAACAASFAHGTALTLTAVPTVGSSFAGWSGACGGTGPCGFTITQPVTLTATFNITLPYRTYLPLVIRGAAPLAGPIRQWPAGWWVFDVVTRKWGQ